MQQLTAAGAAVWGVLAVNAITFALWGFDKRQARRRGRRVPEAHLLLCAAATGFVGAWLGVFVFRHKTLKVGFRLLLAAASLANVVWFWLGWRSGLFA